MRIFDDLRGPLGNLEAGYRPILFTLLVPALFLRLGVAWQLPNIQ